MFKYRKQLFNAPSNTTVAADVVPAISVDYTSRIRANITQFREMLGISDMIPLAAGNVINIYKITRVNTPNQVGEGETIALTEIKREVAKQITLNLLKYRKNTTAEAIQKVGRDVAVNMTDEKFISEIQKDVKGMFFTSVKTGTGTATAGATLQATLANLWDELQQGFEDQEVSPIYFVHPTDIAGYLGSAAITVQTAFGMSYVKDFLGLGTVVITTQVTAGDVWATAKENLLGYYAPIGGDVAQTFGLTADETGLIGMCHSVKTENASIDTLAMCGVVFAPELVDHVYKGEVNP